jgi:hypothetical protein
MPDGIRCTRCRFTTKQTCPRIVDFYIKRIARRLARSEEYVKDLYSRHGARKRPGGAGGSKPSQVTRGGVGKPKGAVTESNHGEFIIIEEDEEEEEEEEEEEDRSFELDQDEASRGNRTHVLRSQPKTTKEEAVMHSDHKNELLDCCRKKRFSVRPYFISFRFI